MATKISIRASQGVVTVFYGKRLVATLRSVPKKAEAVAKAIGEHLRSGGTLDPKAWNRTAHTNFGSTAKARMNKLFGFNA